MKRRRVEQQRLTGMVVVDRSLHSALARLALWLRGSSAVAGLIVAVLAATPEQRSVVATGMAMFAAWTAFYATTVLVQLLRRGRVHPEHNVRGRRIPHRRARVHVPLVREARRQTRTRVNHHLVSQLAQLLHRRRRGRHPPLTRTRLPKDTDDHNASRSEE